MSFTEPKGTSTETGDISTISRTSPFFCEVSDLRAYVRVRRHHVCRLKIQQNVLNVVVREFGRMEFDTLHLEKCSDICAETVVIGFHARSSLSPVNFPFFLFLGSADS
jgi:hypothetical protein